MAENAFLISSQSSSGCACWDGVISAFQNLGWWLDQLITKVIAAVSLFFQPLASGCSDCAFTSFQNLGLWLHTQVNRLTSLFQSISRPSEEPSPPPAAPRRPPRRDRKQPPPRRSKTDLELLADEIRRRSAEQVAVGAAQTHGETERGTNVGAHPAPLQPSPSVRDLLKRDLSAGVSQASPSQERDAAPTVSDPITRERLERALLAGMSQGELNKERGAAPPPVKRRSRGARVSQDVLRKSNLKTLRTKNIFVSDEHALWFGTLENIPHPISLLIACLSEPHRQGDRDGSAAEDPESDHLLEQVRGYVRLRYLRSILPLASDSGQHVQDRLAIFSSLTEGEQRSLMGRSGTEEEEWDGTIPEGMWQDQGLGERIDHMVQELILQVMA